MPYKMTRIFNNGFIQMVRGDSFIAPLFLNIGTKITPIRYSLLDHPNSKVYLGIMEPNQPFEEAIVRKNYDKDSNINEFGDVIVELKPQDTEYLLPGTYYYEVKILEENGNVQTVIPKTEFVLM